MEDKRRHPRRDETIVTTYEIPDFEDRDGLRFKERPCWLRQISENGAMIETDRHIPIKTAILLNIAIGDGDRQGEDEHFTARGETRWFREMDGDVHRIGIEFNILSESDRHFIRDYVASRLIPMNA